MGAHLLSLSELCPALQHLASDGSIARLTRTYLGRSLARSVRALADEVCEFLGEQPATRTHRHDEVLGDLGGFPGYAVMACEHRGAAEREPGPMLWSGLDPASAMAPVAVEPGPGGDAHPARTELRMRAVMLLNDVRQGLRIEARYRPLPVDLDARLFDPLDAAVRRRRARSERAHGRSWGDAAIAAVRAEALGRAAPSSEAGPVSR